MKEKYLGKKIYPIKKRFGYAFYCGNDKVKVDIKKANLVVAHGKGNDDVFYSASDPDTQYEKLIFMSPTEAIASTKWSDDRFYSEFAKIDMESGTVDPLKSYSFDLYGTTNSNELYLIDSRSSIKKLPYRLIDYVDQYTILSYNEEGKVGVIDSSGDQVFPFTLDESIAKNAVVKHEGNTCLILDKNTNIAYVATSTESAPVTIQLGEGETIDFINYQGFISIYNQETNQTRVYNVRENKLTDVGVYSGRVDEVCSVYDSVNSKDKTYLIRNGRTELVKAGEDKTIVSAKKIELDGMKQEYYYGAIGVFKLTEEQGVGVYYAPSDSVVLSPEVGIEEIDFKNSGINSKGTARFLVRKGDSWGVMDSKGKVVHDFELSSVNNQGSSYGDCILKTTRGDLVLATLEATEDEDILQSKEEVDKKRKQSYSHSSEQTSDNNHSKSSKKHYSGKGSSRGAKLASAYGFLVAGPLGAKIAEEIYERNN